jgi:hypothetical protein
MSAKRYLTSMNILIAVVFVALYFYGDTLLFILAYFAVFLFVSFRTIQSTGRKRTRALLIVTYFVVFLLQVIFYYHIVTGNDGWAEHPLRKLLAVAIILFPMAVSRYVAVNKYTELYLPSLQEAGAISFSQLQELTGKLKYAKELMVKTKDNLSYRNFKEITDDLPKHDSFNYVNSGSLTDEYFLAAEKSLDDPSLYIVISNTGTAASEIISVFTQNQFNHASLSFDVMLETIISYNGGVNVYPPGLNPEMVDFLCKKEDASILIYRLPVTIEQKKLAYDKIKQINQEGSAYNMLGLVTGHSYKPNIMYCSQFVYKILELIGVSYFETEGTIKPTDLIEKDYHRKLEFVKEIKLTEKPIRYKEIER